ncbi:MAG: carboxylating nicotinate-nucleotide diphosphorylase [Crocinitomicaceae bacterium]|nr:carboxylating nicotinate-nucleotide diphosphorylase [Crocinitomicaceae bacterium]
MNVNTIDVDNFLRRAIAEDVGDGDHTTLSTIAASAYGKARLLVKDNGVIAGIEIARRVFELIDPDLRFEKLLSDGDAVKFGDIAFYVDGKAQSITIAERLVLNIMQRMSGIATKTARIQGMISGTRCKVLDTRKTTPCFRYFEKLAVHTGGGENHRFGLYDMILIKDNHIDYSGGMTNALRNVKEYLDSTGRTLRVEAEARSMKEIEDILEAGSLVFRILIDNFSPGDLREAVKLIDGRAETEASGNINEENVFAYAETGVDYISMGTLTHHIESLDLSLKAVTV